MIICPHTPHYFSESMENQLCQLVDVEVKLELQNCYYRLVQTNILLQTRFDPDAFSFSLSLTFFIPLKRQRYRPCRS